MRLTESKLRSIVRKVINETMMIKPQAHYVWFSSAGYDWDSDGVYSQEEMDSHEGKKIVDMSLATPGFYDITLDDGTVLDAISVEHIKL